MLTLAELKQMTLPEKLQLMEQIWDEVCRREEEVQVADWHKEILDVREQQLAEGAAMFVEWESAKARIAKRTT